MTIGECDGNSIGGPIRPIDQLKCILHHWHVNERMEKEMHQ